MTLNDNITEIIFSRSLKDGNILGKAKKCVLGSPKHASRAFTDN